MIVYKRRSVLIETFPRHRDVTSAIVMKDTKMALSYLDKIVPFGPCNTFKPGYNDMVFPLGDIVMKGISLRLVLLRFLYKIASNYRLL